MLQSATKLGWATLIDKFCGLNRFSKHLLSPWVTAWAFTTIAITLLCHHYESEQCAINKMLMDIL